MKCMNFFCLVQNKMSSTSQQTNCCYDFSGRVIKDLRVTSLQTGKFGICCKQAARTFGNDQLAHIEHWDLTSDDGLGNTTIIRYIEHNEDMDMDIDEDNIFILNRPIAAVVVAISRTQFDPPTEDIGTWSMEVVDTTGTPFPGTQSDPLLLGSQDDFVGQLTYIFDTPLPFLTRWVICLTIANPNNPNQGPDLAGSIAVVYAD